MRHSLLSWVFVFISSGVIASEGFWPLNALPSEQIKKECGVELSDAWVQRAMRASAMIRFGTGGGSGAIVSKNGLLVTNRHVVSEILGALSTDGKNLVRDGFLAADPLHERSYKGVSVWVPQSIEVLPAKYTERLRDDEAHEKGRQMFKQGMQREISRERGLTCEIVEQYGGTEAWLYSYKVYIDVRLVYAPDQDLGDFGGGPDNFMFPRHELDVAFLRVYENGKPADTPDFFKWSQTGARENDAIFSVGFPGHNQRELPVAYLRYLCEVKFPVQVAILSDQRRALELQLEQGGLQAGQVQSDLQKVRNREKMLRKTMETLQSPGVMAALEVREKEWRAKIAASPMGTKQLGNAYESSEKYCESLRKLGARAEFVDPQGLKFVIALQSLLALARRAETNPGSTAAAQRSIKSFLTHRVFSDPGLFVDVEESLLEGVLSAAEKKLPADDPLRELLLKARGAIDVAQSVYRKSELVTLEGCIALLEKGPEAIRDSKDPALEFARALMSDKAAEVRQEIAVHENNCAIMLGMIQRALHAVSPERPPETNRAPRLTFGRAQGFELNGAVTPWRTTFRSQLEKAATSKEPGLYRVSPLVKADAGAELDTPLNFIATTDGGPGCSGAPAIDAQGNLVGVMFDGNAQRVASLYYYAPENTGARSIAVHSAAVLYALKLSGAEWLIKELTDK